MPLSFLMKTRQLIGIYIHAAAQAGVDDPAGEETDVTPAAEPHSLRSPILDSGF